MEWLFVGEVIEWRGPAPYLFVAIPPEVSEEIRDESRDLVYWGQVPVAAAIGTTPFATALFPRNSGYLLPVKVAIRRAESIALGDRPTVRLALRARTSRS